MGFGLHSLAILAASLTPVAVAVEATTPSVLGSSGARSDFDERITAEARRLSALCEEVVEAERTLPGGALTVTRRWRATATRTPEAEVAQRIACEIYFAGYSKAEEHGEERDVPRR